MTLALKIQKLSKSVSTDGGVAVDAVREGCVQLALTLMSQATGTLRSSATKLLVALLSRSEGLDVVESSRAELIALLYDDLYSDRLDMLVYALSLLAILVSYFEDSFQLVDKVAREAAAKRSEEAFKPLVDSLSNNSTDAQKAGASILCVLTERSLTLGCNECFVATLRHQNIEKVIHTLKAKTQQGDVLATTTSNTTFVLMQSGVTSELRMHLDSLDALLCAKDSEWNKSVAVTRQQAQLCAAEATRLSSPKLAARVAALTGIAKLAGVETDEKALIAALTQHLHAMEAKLEVMSEQQQREASAAIERQQRAMDAQLQTQRRVFEEKLAALARESELGAASKAQAALELELQALRENQSLLLQEHAKNQQNVAEQAYLRQHKQLWLFYQCIQLKLNEVLLGYKVLASNLTSETAVEVTLAGQPVPLPASNSRSSNNVSGIAVSGEATKKKKTENRAKGRA